MTFHATIHVSLKKDVADVQGAAIQQSLAAHHHPVESVRAGKYFEVTINADSASVAEEIARKLAAEVFSNPVIESATVSIKS